MTQAKSILRFLVMTVLWVAATPALAVCIPNPFPPNWLQLQENAGGHTIARHVGRTDQQLVNRLINSPGINEASTYPDQPTATAAITTALGVNRVAINNWAQNALNGARRVGHYNHAANVGRVAFRPPNLANIAPESHFRTVLVADGAGGCLLLTSFPEFGLAPLVIGAAATMPVNKEAPVTGDEWADLLGYLAANFSDSDLEGQTDEQAAVAGLTPTTKAAFQEVLTQGRTVLNSKTFDWRNIPYNANRYFAEKDPAFLWLEKMMNALEEALRKMQ